MAFLHCICMGTSRKTGVSAWHELTLCLVFNGGLWLRDNVLKSYDLIMCQVVTRRDRQPSGGRPASLVRHMYLTVKARKSVRRRTTPAVRP